MFTITTAKGSFSSDSLTAVCEWQANMQGAFAEISDGEVEVSVDDIDFGDRPACFIAPRVSARIAKARRERDGEPEIETLDSYPVTEDGADW